MSWLETVRQSLRMEDVLNRYIGTPNRAKKYLCPFHQDKNPSLSINPKTDRFMCFSCGERGDIVDFVQKFYGLPTQRDALEAIDRDFSLGLTEIKEDAETVRRAKQKREQEKAEQEEFDARVKSWLREVWTVRRIMQDGYEANKPKKGEPMERYMNNSVKVNRCQWFWYRYEYATWLEGCLNDWEYDYKLEDCPLSFDITVLGENPTLFIQGGDKSDFLRRKKAVLEKLEKGEISTIWEQQSITT